MQRIKYSKDEIEGRELEVQETLTALDAPGSFHSGCHENISAGGGDPHPLAPARPHHNTATTLTSKNGMAQTAPSLVSCRILTALRFFLLSQSQHFSLGTFNQARVRSARTPFPDRGDLRK